MMPRCPIPCDDTKLADSPDITRSVIVIEATEDGVDPYTWCTTNPADEQHKVYIHIILVCLIGVS